MSNLTCSFILIPKEELSSTIWEQLKKEYSITPKWQYIRAHKNPYVRIRPVYFLKETKTHYLVPSGFISSFKQFLPSLDTSEIDAFIEKRKRLKPKELNPKTPYTLRTYQKEATEALVKLTRGVLVSPTGSGKTLMMSEMLRYFRKTLVLVPQLTAIRQTAKVINEHILCNLTKNASIYKANEEHDVCISTVLSAKNLPLDTYDSVFCDECLTGDTLVSLNDGTPIEIQKIENAMQVLGGKVTNKFSKKVRILYSVQGAWGTIECTKTHPWITVPNAERMKLQHIFQYPYKIKETAVRFREASKLKQGDGVLVPKCLPHVYKTDKISPSEAQLHALIATDGHSSKNYHGFKIEVTRDPQWVFNTLSKPLKSLGIPLRSHKSRHGTTFTFNSVDLQKNFEALGIPLGKKSGIVTIPDEVFKSSIQLIKNYISIAFDAEGWVSNDCSVRIQMASRSFIYKLRMLLMKFGIHSSIFKLTYPHKRNPRAAIMYRLAISEFSNVEQFKHKIGFTLQRKQNKLLEVLKVYAHKKRRFHKEVIFHKKSYYVFPIKRVLKLKRVTPVFDFTTTSHTFIANGILTHNCHRLPSTTYTDVVQKCTNAWFRYGFTGTVKGRSDELDRLIDAALSMEHYEVPRDETKKFLSGSKVVIFPCTCTVPPLTQDFVDIYRSGIVSNRTRNEMISAICSHHKDDTILVFVNWAEHGRILQSMISESRLLTHTNTEEERYEVMANWKGKTIIATKIFGESIDVPNINVIINAAAGRAEIATTQLVGRGLRQEDGKILIVYDFSDEGHYLLKQHAKQRQRIYTRITQNIHCIGSLDDKTEGKVF